MVDVLKKCWGFDGMLVSDWGGVQDTGQLADSSPTEQWGPWRSGVTGQGIHDRWLRIRGTHDGPAEDPSCVAPGVEELTRA